MGGFIFYDPDKIEQLTELLCCPVHHEHPKIKVSDGFEIEACCEEFGLYVHQELSLIARDE